LKVFGIVGFSGSGKTTLLKRLIPEIRGRGVRVATVKHTHHKVKVDGPGDPGFDDRLAGAVESVVASRRRFVSVREGLVAQAGVPDILARLEPVDLVLIEGFKRYAHVKLEVHRAATGRELWCVSDPHVVAVASDVELANLAIPRLDLDDVAAIADFILAHPGP
jgi:molybdopterin-guanine dinucleotide biosynthesis protein B